MATEQQPPAQPAAAPHAPTDGSSQPAPADAPTTLEERLDALEARLQILDLVARYGPAVDSGHADAVAELWAPEGSYSYTLGGGTDVLRGHEGMRAMVHGDMHQGIIADGAAHLMGLPVVELCGDRAVVTGYSTLVRHHPQDGSFRIDRSAASRWECARVDGVWAVTERVNLRRDGRESARFLLGRVGETPCPGDGVAR